MQVSFWEQDAFFGKPDVLIVGAGIVGLSAAIQIKEERPEWDVLVVERGALPNGASTKNAGFACFGSIGELVDDLQSHSEDELFDLVAMRYDGLQQLKAWVAPRAMEYRTAGGFELFTDPTAFAKAAAAIPMFNAFVEEITGLKTTFSVQDAPFTQATGCIVNHAEGQLHPGKMMRSLLARFYRQGGNVLWATEISNLADHGDEVEVQLASGFQFSAQRVIVATNGFARQLLPTLEVMAVRNQVLVTAPLANLPFQGCYHLEKGYVYFRNINNRILIGGGRHLAKAEETTDQFGTTPLIRTYLQEVLETLVLPDQNVPIEYEWSGILGVGAQKKPIIRAVSANIVAAVRLGGMGVAIGTLVGKQAANQLLTTS